MFAGHAAGLRAVVRQLQEGATFADAVALTFGITEDAFEKRWKRSLVDRYGWLYVMSRAGVFWLGVTLLVLFVAIRRSRRDRQRLTALREEERRTSTLDPGVPVRGPETGGEPPPARPD